MSQQLLKIVANQSAFSSAFQSEVVSQFKQAYPVRHALVFGSTGEVGKEVVCHLLVSGAFDKVTAVTRRNFEYEGPNAEYLTQLVVDYDKLEDFAKDISDHGHAFCCLGSTSTKHGTDEFTKVDHDYTVKLAKICREQGVEHFTLCSSSMANENSRIFYLKIKGKVENEIKSMQFPRYSIFRPGMLTCKRQESRPLESIANSMLKIISPVLPWSLSVPTKSVAKAMVINACRKPSEVPIVEHISHKLIINLAKEY